jgi:hypothetical protein
MPPTGMDGNVRGAALLKSPCGQSHAVFSGLLVAGPVDQFLCNQLEVYSVATAHRLTQPEIGFVNSIV